MSGIRISRDGVLRVVRYLEQYPRTRTQLYKNLSMKPVQVDAVLAILRALNVLQVHKRAGNVLFFSLRSWHVCDASCRKGLILEHNHWVCPKNWDFP